MSREIHDHFSAASATEIEGTTIRSAHFAATGRTPRSFCDEEIVERCIYALVNEGAYILQEGIAARASDIDLVYVHGYGFPRWRGGPMMAAQTVGLASVVRAIERIRSDGRTEQRLRVTRPERATAYPLTQTRRNDDE